MPPIHPREMHICIDHCEECHAICLDTLQYCMEQGGPHAAPHHIGLLEDCAQICQISADFMRRGSKFHGETCRACATICEHCAEDCASFPGDSQMEECTQMCRQCAESCHAMSCQAMSTEVVG